MDHRTIDCDLSVMDVKPIISSSEDVESLNKQKKNGKKTLVMSIFCFKILVLAYLTGEKTLTALT